MKKHILKAWLIIAISLFCTNVTGQVPTVETLSPSHGAADVVIDGSLVIEFGVAIKANPSEIFYIEIFKDGARRATESFEIEDGVLPPTLSISGSSLTISPEKTLLYETTYYVLIESDAIQSIGGIGFSGILTSDEWSFTTGAAVLGPEIVSVTPPKDTTDVSINPTFAVEFDSDIQLGSSGFFKIKRKDDNVLKLPFLNGMGEISVSGNQLNIDATNSNLDYNTTYYVEISSDFIQNFPGISDPTVWTFTTETAPPKWAENYPTITQSSTGFTFKGKSDLTGKYYFVVTGSLTPPNKEQIKAGKNSSGGNAYMSFSGDMIGNNEFSTNMDFASELLRGNSYYLHALVASDDGKNGEVETRSIDRIPPSINDVSSYPINGYDLFPVKDNIRIVFSEKVFNHNGGVTELTSASFSLTKDGDTVAFNFAVSLDGTEITLTPKSPLSGNTEYTVVISPLSDEFYNVMTSSVTRTFHTDKLNVWNGGISSSWTVAGNWDNGSYVSGKSVLIPDSLTHYPVIDSDITVNNFTIEAGAVVTQTGGVITVLGDFDLLSSEATNASYLPKGGELLVQGETRVHQHIVPEKGLIDYLMGSPTYGTNYANFGTPYLIKYYENPTASWVSIGSTNMLPGVGYAVYSLNDLVFRGDINRASVEVPLHRSTGKGYGWNLLGNPYTASINWDDLNFDTEKVENSYWIWDTKNKVYGAFNQETGIGLNLDGEIPSNHAFLVKLKLGYTSDTLTFEPDAMVVNSKNYLKSASNIKTPHMKILAGTANYKDQLAVAFVPDASVGLDKYDAEKFFGTDSPFQIYTVSGSTNLSINSLPETNKETTVSLGYRTNRAGTYTIQLNENYLDYYEVVLTDTKDGKEVDLLYEGSYTFTVDKKETNNNRFTLTFPAMVSTPIEKAAPETDLNIYPQNGDIIAELSSGSGDLTYELVAVSGQVVKRGELHSGVNNLGKQPSGLFIINTRNEEGTIVSKKLLVTR